MALRVKHKAPFRCRQCGLRFIADEDEATIAAAKRPLSIADYLGLRGWARRFFTDHVIMAAIALLLFIVLVIVFLGFAFGWFNLQPPGTEQSWPPGGTE